MKAHEKSSSKHTRAICTALILIFLLSLSACAQANSAPQPSASFLEDEVPYPRMYYSVLYSRSGESGGLYYIPLCEDDVELCRAAFTAEERKRVEPEDTVSLFKVELNSEQHFTAYESISGGYFFTYVGSPGVKADEAAENLLGKIGEASGQDAGMTLPDFKSACEVELIKDGEILWATVDEAVLTEIGTLLDAYIGSGPSNFDNYDYELRCTFADGGEHTLLLSSDDGFIFLPPLRYYKLPKLSPLRADGWTNIFGMETWPG